jgi:hypothetical protein
MLWYFLCKTGMRSRSYPTQEVEEAEVEERPGHMT